jgi:hypothetical protein
MLDRLERIGEVGDAVVVDGIRLEVLEVEEFAITQVLLRLDPDAGIVHNDDDGDGISDHDEDVPPEGDR